MIQVTIFNQDIEHTEFWNCNAIPRTGDWLELKPRTVKSVSDNVFGEAQTPYICGQVRKVIWKGDGIILLFVE